MDDTKAMSAIFYALCTGCQWKAVPRSFGASSPVMIDSKSGGKKAYSNVCGLIEYQYVLIIIVLNGNGRMVVLQNHLLGKKSTGPNPTDRNKSGTKRRILVAG